MLMNSDLSPVNSDMSSCLSINLYPHSYHNLADQSCLHTAHTHGAFRNHYIEDIMK